MVRAMSAHPAPLSAPLAPAGGVRHDWSLEEVEALFAQPFMDLILRAQLVHRAHHAANTVQMSTLLSIKTGACPEDCAYCPQSVRYDTGVGRESLMELEAVRELGLESCATLGMLTEEQAQLLRAAGLDYYNHNLDTSAEYYGEIITTRSYQDRLDTLAAVRAAGLKVCCGGIL